ncbi:olfactory receptor 52E8-like [Protopterus annectens]|uniref:olfactory receptor 52E8-like n=1 Tax=Protopterus annectens TaxID=7888 RepID=UPI001CFA6B9E|nr:olfactory receptor 52E8-like [Protopterus annectens]
MSDTNYSSGTNLEIVLMGFPGLHDTQQWLSIPLLMMFLVAFFGNLTVLIIIVIERSLHEPMYYFISMLSAVDLVITMTLLPKFLNVLWFGSQILSYNDCLAQLLFNSFFCTMESSMLVLMAFDRYIAVCNPLRYRAIIENKSALKVSLFVAIRGLCIGYPILMLAPVLLNSGGITIPSLFCEYFAVNSAVHSNILVSNNDVFILLLLLALPDLTIIGFSYCMIAKAVLKLGLRESHQKILNTCTSHIIVIASFYLWVAMSLMTTLFENKVPEYILTLFSVLYITVPPTLNPLIYGIKTKEIRQNIFNGDNLEIVLMGFHGLHDIQHWISIPFFVMFLTAFFGNLTVLLIIATEQSLHEPLYYFIFMLSAMDFVAVVGLLPSLLSVLCGLMSLIREMFQGKVPNHIPVLLSVLHIIVPPTLNPLIYSIKTKVIRQIMLKHLRKH